jgi:hypothetical protein
MKLKELNVQSKHEGIKESFVGDSKNLLDVLEHPLGLIKIYRNRMVFSSLEIEESPILKIKHELLIDNGKKIVSWVWVGSNLIDIAYVLSSNEIFFVKFENGELKIINQKKFENCKSIFEIETGKDSIFVLNFNEKVIFEYDYSFNLKKTINLSFPNACDFKIIHKPGNKYS